MRLKKTAKVLGGRDLRLMGVHTSRLPGGRLKNQGVNIDIITTNLNPNAPLYGTKDTCRQPNRFYSMSAGRQTSRETSSHSIGISGRNIVLVEYLASMTQIATPQLLTHTVMQE